MAKIPFSKLGIKINTDISYVTIGEYQIEVKQYLPMEEKAALVANIMNFSVDDTGFYNPLRVKTFLTLEIMYTYTNLGFTAKMKEEGLKLYDTVISSGLFDKIIEASGNSVKRELAKTLSTVKAPALKLKWAKELYQKGDDSVKEILKKQGLV